MPFDAVISDLHFTPARNAEGLEIVAQAPGSAPAAAVLLFTAAAEGAVPRRPRSSGAPTR